MNTAKNVEVASVSLYSEAVQFAVSVLLCKKILPWDFSDALYALRDFKEKPADVQKEVRSYFSMYQFHVRPEPERSLSKCWKLLTSGGVYFIASALFNSLNNKSYQGEAYLDKYLPSLDALGKVLLKITKKGDAQNLSYEDKRALVKNIRKLGVLVSKLQAGSGAFFLSIPTLRDAGNNEESVLDYFSSLPYLPASLQTRLAKKHATEYIRLNSKPKAPVVKLY